MWVASDSTNGYFHDLEVYAGKEGGATTSGLLNCHNGRIFEHFDCYSDGYQEKHRISAARTLSAKYRLFLTSISKRTQMSFSRCSLARFFAGCHCDYSHL